MFHDWIAPSATRDQANVRRRASEDPNRGTVGRAVEHYGYKHSSIHFWLFVAFVLFLLFVGVPWMINHPEAGHHHPSSSPTAIPNP
jgi:hypothetical protein